MSSIISDGGWYMRLLLAYSLVPAAAVVLPGARSLSTMASNGVRKHILNRLTPEEVGNEIKDPVDPTALEQAKAILSELCGEKGGVVNGFKLLEVAQRLGDLPAGSSSKSIAPTSFTVSKADCRAAYEGLSDRERAALTNMHGRVRAFADLQRRSVTDVAMDIPGGRAGHTVAPCQTAGCYAPGGRYPLPSSVIMTAGTARAAGCERVILASPRPAAITLAAAHIAGVDDFICVGGAQAIASLAYGVDDILPRCDVICGPGNKWVTAAKSIVNGHCGIDMLAGPSEVLVICDETANPEIVAADLIAQAEHDVVARAIMLSTCADMIEKVDQQVAVQIACLPEPNKSTALEALTQSFAVKCDSIEQCIRISDDIAPEHLEIQTKEAVKVAESCVNYGGLFIGAHAAEVLRDYGAGPNHTLPTGGTGRYTGGLSVFNFLRIRTWMRVDDAEKSQAMVDDTIVLARLEGLEGHARAAETRSLTQTPAFRGA